MIGAAQGVSCHTTPTQPHDSAAHKGWPRLQRRQLLLLLLLLRCALPTCCSCMVKHSLAAVQLLLPVMLSLPCSRTTAHHAAMAARAMLCASLSSYMDSESGAMLSRSRL
jgi:hypothetical protein